MTRMTRARCFGLAFASLSTMAAVGAGCSLKLDPSLMNASPLLTEGGSAPGAGKADAGPAQALDIGDGGAPPDLGGHCASDSDCASAAAGNACVASSRCDPTW